MSSEAAAFKASTIRLFARDFACRAVVVPSVWSLAAETSLVTAQPGPRRLGSGEPMLIDQAPPYPVRRLPLLDRLLPIGPATSPPRSRPPGSSPDKPAPSPADTSDPARPILSGPSVSCARSPGRSVECFPMKLQNIVGRSRPGNSQTPWHGGTSCGGCAGDNVLRSSSGRDPHTSSRSAQRYRRARPISGRSR